MISTQLTLAADASLEQGRVDCWKNLLLHRVAEKDEVGGCGTVRESCNG